MAKRQGNKLSAQEVKNWTAPGRYGDGLGLWLQIGPSGSKSWTFSFARDGKQRNLGLGPVKHHGVGVSLGEARTKAQELRQQLLDGSRPVGVKAAAKAAKAAELAAAEAKRLEELRVVTFAQAAAQFMATEKIDALKDRAGWRSTIAEVCETIGSLPLEKITRPLVLKALQPMHDRGAKETARRTRGRIERVFAWALAHDMYAGTNPAAQRDLRDAMPAKPKAKHHAAMSYQELPNFMQRLRASDSMSAHALELTILCATRTSETRLAIWSEFDLEVGLWCIPGERTKTKKPHRVPLSDRAVELLRAMPRHGEHVFGNGKPLSNMALLEMLRGMAGNGYTVHGFRSSFSDWCRDRTAWPRDVVEMALAHTIKDKSEAAYRRGDALDKRRRLMAEWARYLEAPAGVGDNVRALRA